ncbi:heme-binding protein 2 [Engraulis encrasicolus]|uniref:heme-binding protein 2 n=1 Tax=Engraulis encrasicolus TaxID=184585 RepID=UPI002FD5C031
MVWAPLGMLLVAFAMAAEATVGPCDDTTHGTETKECLHFTTICSGEEYEVRSYDNTKWISAVEESYFMDMAITRAFWKLFKYIQGNNAAGLKIDMTSPVVIKTKDTTSMWTSSKYKVSFLLPSAFQDGAQEPPAPKDGSVFFEETPAMKLYVRSYGGWLMGLTSRTNARDLRMALQKAGASFVKGSHYDVGYDSPMKMTERHNEAWYAVEGDHVCPK